MASVAVESGSQKSLIICSRPERSGKAFGVGLIDNLSLRWGGSLDLDLDNNLTFVWPTLLT